MNRSRRAFLGATGAVSVSALAGCLGGPTADPSGGDATTPTANEEAIRLDTVDVGGSTGDPVPLRTPGRVTLLDFFATWCGTCRTQMAHLRDVRRRFDERELHLVSITPETDEFAVRSFWTDHDGTWPVALDPETVATMAYDVKGIPTLVVVLPDGTEHWRHRGLAGVDSVTDQVRDALDDVP